MERARVAVCEQMFVDELKNPKEVSYAEWWDGCYPDGSETRFNGVFLQYVRWVFDHPRAWGSQIEFQAFARYWDVDVLLYMSGHATPDLYPGRPERRDNPREPILVLGFAERHWSWYQCNGANIPRFERLTPDQWFRGAGRPGARRPRRRRKGGFSREGWSDVQNGGNANCSGEGEAETNRMGSDDDEKVQSSWADRQAAAEASDDTFEVVRCVLCEEKIWGEPVTHEDGTLWHFGCDRQRGNSKEKGGNAGARVDDCVDAFLDDIEGRTRPAGKAEMWSETVQEERRTGRRDRCVWRENNQQGSVHDAERS